MRNVKLRPSKKEGLVWQLATVASVCYCWYHIWTVFAYRHDSWQQFFGLLKVCKCFKVFSFRGLRPLTPDQRLCPQTPVIGSRSRALHVLSPLPLPGKISMGAHGAGWQCANMMDSTMLMMWLVRLDSSDSRCNDCVLSEHHACGSRQIIRADIFWTVSSFLSCDGAAEAKIALQYSIMVVL